MAYDFDLLTIGAGSGGVAGSRRAASYGAKVGLIEAGRVGGTCVLRGCVPKKLLVYGTSFAHEFEDAAGFGWSVGESSLDWAKLVGAKDLELDRLNGIYLGMIERAGVSLIEGRAKLVDPHTVEVGDRRITAETILIATGGHAVRPAIPGAELGITSDEALDLKILPKRIVVIGGGYIGVEFASIFEAAGVEVAMVLRNTQVLGGFDLEVRQALTDALSARGIAIHASVLPTALEKTASGLRLSLSSGEAIETDQVLFATGRRPNSANLGLAELGIHLTPTGAISVDEWSRTSIPNIYAVGDVTDRMNLTPVAIAEARGVAETLYNANPMKPSHDLVPTAVFTTPSVATVGLSEEAALAAGHRLNLFTTRFRPMKATLSGRQERIFMKLVVDRDTDKVLGCHMVGHDSAEIIQGLAVALVCGATKAQFDRTIGIHPSAAEEFVTMRDPRQADPATKAEAKADAAE